MVLTIIGPSGSGKSTVMSELARRGIVHLTPTVTDRPVRPGEADHEHRFVSPAEFDRLHAAGQLLHVVTPFGLPYRYGLLPLEITDGKIPTVLIRAPYLKILRTFYPEARCYQIEAPYEFAAEAVAARGQEIGSRLSDFQRELELGRQVADRVFLNTGQDLGRLVEDINTALNEDVLHTL